MEHLGTRLRTIGLDKVPSLAQMSPGLDESGTDAGNEISQVWTEMWALHRESKEVESKDSAGTAATPGAEQERKQGWTREKEPQF
jgi:hypothetical protein